jgi:Rrf2 family transcriptional regulator, cysteine metabolism repressor
VHEPPNAMISISSKSPYAVLALAELGRSSGSEPVPIGELARRRDVPVQFLEQLFAVLRRAGIISSQRGVKGGYRFARDPATVTVLEVVELLDGPLGRDAQGPFADAAEAARKVLGSTTIADVIERETREAGASIYHI